MSRTLSLSAAAVLSLLVVALAACGGDNGEKTTQTGTETAEGTAVGPTFSGNATATVKSGNETFTFKNGKCQVGPEDAWLVVNIGDPGGDTYFGLLVGANPAATAEARPVSGGGMFTDGEIAVAGKHSGVPFAMSGEGSTVTVAGDLQSGSFEGTAFDGQPISGSFKC